MLQTIHAKPVLIIALHVKRLQETAKRVWLAIISTITSALRIVSLDLTNQPLSSTHYFVWSVRLDAPLAHQLHNVSLVSQPTIYTTFNVHKPALRKLLFKIQQLTLVMHVQITVQLVKTHLHTA